VKDRNLTAKIKRILGRKSELDRLNLSSDLRRADEYLTELELSRDLTQIIVHIDCDAFYAAVEELDRPELKDVPMAVGKGVLTTCNYHARKFGCRSGMAGFVAMKLCPQLICLPLNFEKYIAKAQEVRSVLANYDSRFESASIDEAYLNITEYCHQHQRTPDDVVSQMRAEVFQKAKITISAGIAANSQLSKICSNKNKPNGQFQLGSDRATIMAFMRDLPTRKVNGVGRVFERELDAIGIKTCGDLYAYRAFLAKLFGEKAFQFLMMCYLGLGRTSVRPAEEHERKSVGTESTFRDMSNNDEMREKLHWLAEELEKDLIRTQFKGRTLVLKVKLHTYEVLTRQIIPPHAVSVADDLFKYSYPMLTRLQKEIPGMTLRLMGIRVTHLVSSKKPDVDFFGVAKDCVEGRLRGSVQAKDASAIGEWEVWPESAFELAARQEQEDNMDVVAMQSREIVAEQQDGNESRNPSAWRAYWANLSGPAAKHTVVKSTIPVSKTEMWNCPICGNPQSADDRLFNEHIDFCLSKATIGEAVKASSDLSVASTPLESYSDRHASTARTAKKRRRSGTEEQSNGPVSGQKKLFFA